jgi:hypothetical protein
MPNQIHARPDNRDQYDKEDRSADKKKYHQNINNNISTAVWTTLNCPSIKEKEKIFNPHGKSVTRSFR